MTFPPSAPPDADTFRPNKEPQHKGYGIGTTSVGDEIFGRLRILMSAAVAASYERIHRSNLLGMGVLPLQFKDGKSAESFGLDGTEVFSIIGLSEGLRPGQELILEANDQKIPVVSRLDTPVEIEYYKSGGILRAVLKNFMNKI